MSLPRSALSRDGTEEHMGAGHGLGRVDGKARSTGTDMATVVRSPPFPPPLCKPSKSTTNYTLGRHAEGYACRNSRMGDLVDKGQGPVDDGHDATCHPLPSHVNPKGDDGRQAFGWPRGIAV
ncbi:hypothetical protein CDD83_8661 [Cordyceps sp. RAO-2017]|nr:hypothetical protein CDD83_8661 [Cordyceps sp. RAO-2017]